MIQKVKEFGPFINLGKGVAIPHARPDEGVNEIGINVCFGRTDLYLLDNPEQEMIVDLYCSAIEWESFKGFVTFNNNFKRDKNHVQTLISSKNYDDIKMIIKQEDYNVKKIGTVWFRIIVKFFITDMNWICILRFECFGWGGWTNYNLWSTNQCSWYLDCWSWSRADSTSHLGDVHLKNSIRDGDATRENY